MKKVDIDDLEPGMVIGKPIEDSNGRVLLQEGKELSDTVINSLKNLGQEEIFVLEEDELDGGDDDTLSPEEIEENLDHMFEKVEENEVMMEIKTMASKYLKNKIEDTS